MTMNQENIVDHSNHLTVGDEGCNDAAAVDNDHSYDSDGSASSTTDDENATTTILMDDVTWGQEMMRCINERRSAVGQAAIAWDDNHEACVKQAQLLAKQAAEQGSLYLGDKERIKAALRAAGHTTCSGTFRTTCKTLALTPAASVAEAIAMWQDKVPQIYQNIMQEKAALGGFAAVQRGDRIYWAGIFLRTFDDPKSAEQEMKKDNDESKSQQVVTWKRTA